MDQLNVIYHAYLSFLKRKCGASNGRMSCQLWFMAEKDMYVAWPNFRTYLNSIQFHFQWTEPTMGRRRRIVGFGKWLASIWPSFPFEIRCGVWRTSACCTARATRENRLYGKRKRIQIPSDDVTLMEIWKQRYFQRCVEINDQYPELPKRVPWGSNFVGKRFPLHYCVILEEITTATQYSLFLTRSAQLPHPSRVSCSDHFSIDLITARWGSYGQAACDIMAVVLEVDLGRVNQSRWTNKSRP